MELLIRPTGPLQANCYLLYDKEGGEAVIIDPGYNGKEFIEILNKKNLKLKYIILTHGHGDHIGGVAELLSTFKTELLIHKDDEEMLTDKIKSGTVIIGYPDVNVSATVFIKDGDELSLGDEKLIIIHTPGHTKGGVSILTGNKLFVGDTLFFGSVGRTDFPGGSFEELKNSIQNKLFTLSEDVIVYPGHGGATTIKREKNSNPYVGLKK